MEFILVKKRQKKIKSLEVWGLQVVLLLCLGFLFCCMTQLLLCCWYVALFSRSVKLCNAFFIFTTKTIKVIFWKKLVVAPLFSNWMWGNGKWNCSWSRTSTRHPFCNSVRWQGLTSLLAMLKQCPLEPVCLAFPLQGLYPLLSFWSSDSF